MCGRFTLTVDIEDLQEAFPGVDFSFYLKPSYNIAPSHNVLAITNTEPKKAKQYHWGLIPSWAKDKKIAYKMINARAETLAEKPSFKNPYRKKRCLIFSDGYFEWKKEAKDKVPIYIRMKSGKPFTFAGLWETWKQGDQPVINSCTIITTEANESLKDVHHRMPVILKNSDYDQWLDSSLQDPEILNSLLTPYDNEEMEYYPISTFVNSPKNNSPKCIEAAS